MEITEFRAQWWPLSNYSRHPAWWDGVQYPTSEHAFAAAKTLDPALRQSIQQAASPGEAKKIGRRVPLREGWDEMRISVMRQILVTKFAPGGQPWSVLMGTGTARLVEGNSWHDQFWGDCSCQRHYREPGGNFLGRALMDLRSYYAGA